MATQDKYIKTALRLPRSLHADIQAAAKDRGRSMNAEIIARLEESFNNKNQIGISEAKMKEILEAEISKSYREALAKALLEYDKLKK